MHVVIIGAGAVGTSIADSLDDSHDVVVIDVDEARAEELTYGLDVMTLTGDGTHSAVLREADIESADMMIASTDDDRTNLVACGTATALADPFTIARTKSVEYLSTWENPSRRSGSTSWSVRIWRPPRTSSGSLACRPRSTWTRSPAGRFRWRCSRSSGTARSPARPSRRPTGSTLSHSRGCSGTAR